MKKIKVLHVLHSVGGVDVYLELATKNLDSNQIETIIVHGKKPGEKEYTDQKNKPIKQYYIPIQREINIFKDIKCIYRTVKILKKERPNIVHAHSAKGGIVARVASLFYKINVLHTPHAYSYLSSDSRIKRALFLKIEKTFKHFNSLLLATSESERTRGIEEVGYKPARALVFNNSVLPVQVTDDGIRKKYNLPDKYICTVGRPSFQKNIEMMVEVIKQLKNEIPDIHLVLLGVGVYCPSKENVERLIDTYELNENITMIEWIDRQEIFSIVNKALFYISTSRYEGLPYSMIESLALSKACVATICDGNKDLVKDNYNGYLIAQNDVNEFSEKTLELYKNNSLREQFGNNSFQFFNESFNLNKTVGKLSDMYVKYSR